MNMVKMIGERLEVKPEDSNVKIAIKSCFDGFVIGCILVGGFSIIQYNTNNKLKFFKYTMVRDEET